MMFSWPKNVRLAPLASMLFLTACQTDLPDAPDVSGDASLRESSAFIHSFNHDASAAGALGAASVAPSSESIEAEATEESGPPRCSSWIDFQAEATVDTLEVGGDRSKHVLAIVTVSSNAPVIRFTELRFRVHGPRVITSGELSLEAADGNQNARTLDSVATSDLDSDVLDFRFYHSLERQDATKFPALVLSASFADLAASDEQQLQVTLEHAKATGLVCSYNLPIELQRVQLKAPPRQSPWLDAQ